MNRLIQWALENAPEIDRKVLSRLVNEMDPDEAERFTNAVIGLVNMDVELASLPEHIERSGNKTNLVRLSASYLKDEVKYAYDEEVCRYFKTQEEADEFTKTGRGRWDGRSLSDDNFQFCATHVFTDQRSCCQFDEWKEMTSE